MFRENCKVTKQVQVAPGHFVIYFSSKKIGAKAKPGQFVQITCADSYEPLLPRPFSFLSASATEFSILYHVIGKGTLALSQKKADDVLWVLGPLGNGFSTPQKKEAVVLVGGGVGIPPLYHVATELIKQKKVSKENIHVFLGARNQSLLLCEKDFKKLDVDLKVATDDGSKGKKGFVTQIVEDFLESGAANTRIYTCGPTPMLKAVSALSKKYKVPCEVSVEEPMACGFGVCLGCAIKVRKSPKSDEHRFAIACCEGPVFQAEQILWQ